MKDGKVWTFKQITGVVKTILTLEGWAAPFGRPRHKPVVTDALRLRNSKTRYPGSSAPPTRHIFGPDWDDLTLQGRWMDKDLGVGGANAKAQIWYDFVDASEIVDISWGDIVQYRGLIVELKIARESEAEIAWEMVIGCDYVVGQGPPAEVTKPTVTAAFTTAQQLGISGLLAGQSIAVSSPDWQPDFFESIDNLVSQINGNFARLMAAANQISNLESATAAEANSLLSGIHSLKTSVLVLRNTFSTAAVENALVDRNANSDVNWFRFRTNQEVASTQMLAVLADIEAGLMSTQQGTTRRTYVAQPGDTWESISNRFYGGPDSASTIRDANGIRYGARPLPGRTYTIPN